MTPGARTHGRWVIVRTPDCRVAAAVGCAPDPIVRGRAHCRVLKVVLARGEAAVSGLWTPVDDGVAPSCWHAHRPIHRTQQPTAVVRLPLRLFLAVSLHSWLLLYLGVVYSTCVWVGGCACVVVCLCATMHALAACGSSMVQ